MEEQDLQQRIYEIRGKRVMLDFDLAELYEVETKVLNQAVKRNADRFPPDFMFQLDFTEYHSLRSQFVTLENEGKGKHSKYAPFAFTEHGVTMLASVLRSKKAIQMNIAIVRAFIILKEYLIQSGDIAAQLKEIQQRLTEQMCNSPRFTMPNTQNTYSANTLLNNLSLCVRSPETLFTIPK